ncbi:unnamed protein product, partial [Rhizoctonia solani]
ATLTPLQAFVHALSIRIHHSSDSNWLNIAVMGKFYDSIPESFVPWINEQHCFWVATAPLSADGHVNVSPKGMTGTFKVLGSNSCFYQDLSGSGVETISHLRENGRITIMYVLFPESLMSASTFSIKVQCLQGVTPHRSAIRNSVDIEGIVHELGSPRYEELIPPADRLAGSRAAIEINIHKVGSSCGYSIPFYEYVGERTLLCDVMRPREQRDADGCPEEVKDGE